jgi:signal transduction histidine kinase
MERRRIGRELHDEAGQSLICIRLQLELLEMSLPPDSEVVPKLGEARDLTERTILEIRRLIADLSPAVLEQFGLDAALRQLVKRFQGIHQIKVRLNTSKLRRLPQQLEIVTYRIIQECFNNVSKHSLAANVNISVSSADGLLRLLVDDDGVGFHVESALSKGDSFGLAGIRERVALLGGAFSIESRPVLLGKKSKGQTGGTSIRIELPIPLDANWRSA